MMPEIYWSSKKGNKADDEKDSLMGSSSNNSDECSIIGQSRELKWDLSYPKHFECNSSYIKDLR